MPLRSRHGIPIPRRAAPPPPLATVHMPLAASLPSPRRAVFLACNEAFVPYAAACVHSVLATSHQWHVHLFATNVHAEDLAVYPFAHPHVTVHAEQREFADLESERCYMNSRRFVRYLSVLPSVDLAVYLDTDAIVLGCLDRVVADLGDADLGLVLRPYETAPERQLRACTVATRSTPAALAFWRAYEAALPPQTWYADQLALDAARRAAVATVAPLPETIYSAFAPSHQTAVLVTCTADKLGYHRAAAYAAAYRQAQAAIDARRQAGTADATALVWVCFGADSARLAAIRAGIEDTLATVATPAAVLLLEASAAPQFGDMLRHVSGATYRHIRTGPRHRGCWQKEALWEVARQMLRTMPAIRYAVFLDADCTPLAGDFFSRVQALHETGIVSAQPWRACTDARHADIGGISVSWLVTRGNRPSTTPGAQPGFCWSFDLAWLHSIGGFACCEPLGGGDTLLVHLFHDAAHYWQPDAAQMRLLASRCSVPRQPFAALPVDLVHHSHGPRGNRQYGVRYRAAAATGVDLADVYAIDPDGLVSVLPGPQGDAWLRYLSRRSEWTGNSAHDRTMWQQCLEETPA